jgi:hypothetical protein
VRYRVGRKPDQSECAVFFCHETEQVDGAVGITPLVVIPGHDLEETLLAGRLFCRVASES